jgi:RNA polymerase sigma factor (sigma-70 family)
MNEVSDDEVNRWLLGLQAGDPAGRERVFAYARRRCEGIAGRFRARYSIIGSYDQTDDVTQRTLVRLLEKHDRGQYPLDAETLRVQVVGTLRDVCIELSRKYLGPHAPAKAHEDSRLPEPDEVGTSVSQWAIREERNRLVLSAVGDLPDGQREAVLLRYSEEMTYPEIGETLGVDPKTAERWVKKALGALSKRLCDD